MGERGHARIGAPAVLLAAGVAFTLIGLPLLGDLGMVLGALVATSAAVALRSRVTDDVARRLATGALVAWVGSLLVRAVPMLAHPVVGREAVVAWVAVAILAMGTVTVAAVGAAGAREELGRGHPVLAAGWRSVVVAVVVCHGPVVVGSLLSVTVDGTVLTVEGGGAIAVMGVLVTPLALLARAGWRSDVLPRRARRSAAAREPTSDTDRVVSSG